MEKSKVLEVIRNFQAGNTDLRLANKLDIDYHEFIILVIAYRAVGDPKAKLDDMKRHMACYLAYEKEMPYKDVAELFGTSRNSVGVWTREYASNRACQLAFEREQKEEAERKAEENCMKCASGTVFRDGMEFWR